MLYRELEEVLCCPFTNLSHVSGEFLIWSKVWSGLVLTNRPGTFADVFFQDTECFLSLCTSPLQVGDSVQQCIETLISLWALPWGQAEKMECRPISLIVNIR